MKVVIGQDIHHEHAVDIDGGVQPLSVLATPKPARQAKVYELTDEGRKVLEEVLSEDLPYEAS